MGCAVRAAGGARRCASWPRIQSALNALMTALVGRCGALVVRPDGSCGALCTSNTIMRGVSDSWGNRKNVGPLSGALLTSEFDYTVRGVYTYKAGLFRGQECRMRKTSEDAGAKRGVLDSFSDGPSPARTISRVGQYAYRIVQMSLGDFLEHILRYVYHIMPSLDCSQ